MRSEKGRFWKQYNKNQQKKESQKIKNKEGKLHCILFNGGGIGEEDYQRDIRFVNKSLIDSGISQNDITTLNKFGSKNNDVLAATSSNLELTINSI